MHCRWLPVTINTFSAVSLYSVSVAPEMAWGKRADSKFSQSYHSDFILQQTWLEGYLNLMAWPSGVARLGYNGAHTPGLCAKVHTNIVCPCGVLVMSWLRHCGSHTVWLATFMRDLFSHLSQVCLWWLSLAIQEIEMLRKHRRMKPDSGYFPRHTGTRAEIAISFRKWF